MLNAPPPDVSTAPPAPTGERRAFCTACNVKFLPGAKALLAGVRRHHPEVARYCFMPVAELEAGQRELGDLATVLAPPRAIAGVPERGQIGVSRIFMITLPADVVAYADADAVLCRPAPQLWEVPPGKLAAVTDAAKQIATVMYHAMRPRFYWQFPEIAALPGFNSGVMALRPAGFQWLPEAYERVIREGRYFEDFWSKSESIRSVDQPFFNAVLLPYFHELPWEYNVHCLFDNPIPEDSVIVHFTGRTKPWAENFPRHEPQYLWWARHGLNQSESDLAAARRYILLRTPRRWLAQTLRKLSGTENFYRRRPQRAAPEPGQRRILYLSTEFPDQSQPERGDYFARMLRHLHAHTSDLLGLGVRPVPTPRHWGLREAREPWMVRGEDAWLTPVYLGLPVSPATHARRLREALEIMAGITYHDAVITTPEIPVEAIKQALPGRPVILLGDVENSAGADLVISTQNASPEELAQTVAEELDRLLPASS